MRGGGKASSMQVVLGDVVHIYWRLFFYVLFQLKFVAGLFVYLHHNDWTFTIKVSSSVVHSNGYRGTRARTMGELVIVKLILGYS